jgi:nicotinamide riboside transporter PnuC
MFIYKGLYLTAFNYAVYFALAAMGFVAWKKSLGDHSPAESGRHDRIQLKPDLTSGQ